MTKFLATSAVMFVGLMAAGPALAFTHHPATRAERAQTRDLNLQQLAAAQGQAPSNMQANAAGTQATGATNATNNAAPSADQNAAPAAPNSQPAPQQAAPQTPQTDQAPAASQSTAPQQ